jgi:hypothetical protein
MSIEYDIEEYSILKHKRSISSQHDIEETSISKFKTSISLYPDIEETSISKFKLQNFDIAIYRYRRFLDIDKFSFDIYIRYRSFELRYRISCSSIPVLFCQIQPGLPTRYRTQIAVCTLHCKSIITPGSRPCRPQPQQWRLHSAARPHSLHRAQHRAQPPERASTERRIA